MSLTDRETHFEFGKNWKSYAETIDQKRIDFAIEGVRKLFPYSLEGKTFFDIGCGSGLHSLAALSLGAKTVVAIDIDEDSVATTRDLLSRYAPHSGWTANVQSIFDASSLDQFDIVYSWGVLHHTGDMWRAINQATRFVSKGGRFGIAIYAATKFDALWKLEKNLYSHAPRPIQAVVRKAYSAAFLARLTALRQNPVEYVRNYSRTRGMNFSHDVHDWLGGYPYETATAEELHDRICAMGFVEERSFRLPKMRGFFGTGCHEFVFKNIS